MPSTLFNSRQLVPILKAENVIKAALFGSFARGEQKASSDIDVLVQFRGQKTLLDLVRLKFTLEEKTGRRVDVVTYDSIHPALRKIILKEQKVFYEKRS